MTAEVLEFISSIKIQARITLLDVLSILLNVFIHYNLDMNETDTKW